MNFIIPERQNKRWLLLSNRPLRFSCLSLLSQSILRKFIRRFSLKSIIQQNKVCISLKLIKKKFKVKIAYIVKVKSINTPNFYLLLLSGSFNFLFFLILPDVISNNISVPFLQNILNSLLVLIQFLYILPIKLYKIINYLLYCIKVSS